MRRMKHIALTLVVLLTLSACGALETTAPSPSSGDAAYNENSSTTQEEQSRQETLPDKEDEISESASPEGSSSPVVYFTSDISADGLVRIYEALGWEPQGKTAVKISTGEPPAFHPPSRDAASLCKNGARRFRLTGRGRKRAPRVGAKNGGRKRKEDAQHAEKSRKVRP